MFDRRKAFSFVLAAAALGVVADPSFAYAQSGVTASEVETVMVRTRARGSRPVMQHVAQPPQAQAGAAADRDPRPGRPRGISRAQPTSEEAVAMAGSEASSDRARLRHRDADAL